MTNEELDNLKAKSDKAYEVYEKAEEDYRRAMQAMEEDGTNNLKGEKDD